MRRTFIVIMAFSLMLVAAAPAFARGGPPAGVRPGNQTIAEVAEGAGFTLLLAAVDYIEETNPESPLIAGLLNNDQYTVFAPTEAAFGKLVHRHRITVT